MAVSCIISEIKQYIGQKSQFLLHDAMQAQHMPSCGVCLSVCLSIRHVREFCRNE